MEAWKLTQISIFALGFALLFVGSCGGALYNYRSERGLWMLSMLFAVMIAFFLTCAIWGIAKDMIRFGFYSTEFRSELGWLAAIAIGASYMLWAFGRVAVANWKFSKRTARSSNLARA